MTETKTLPSEQGHWYAQDGTPVYEVPYADPRKGMRATTIRDAKAMGLVPSVTAITRCAAAPGLENWRLMQMVDAALTLPRMDGESLEDFKLRVIEDSKAQSEKAREAGTSLHAALEGYMFGITTEAWEEHCHNVFNALEQYGIDYLDGRAEHCFASRLGYGGKLDWHSDEVLIDFKTTATVTGKKQLGWPEHVQQLAAYDKGIEGNSRRLLNVFVGIEDREVRIVEWPPEDAEWGWACFETLLTFWKLKNRFGNHA